MQLLQFAGTELHGAISISEKALNELLNSPGSPGRGATITVGRDHDVVVRYGLLHARARLPRAIEVGHAPRLTFVLDSTLVALALRAAVRQPYINISGREVTISLADVPALYRFRDRWRYLSSAGLRTKDRAIVVDCAVSIKE